MVWIIALLCMGLTGLAGYGRGPIRGAFMLLGLWAGILLARPLSPLSSHLLPVLGLHHPLWRLFMPGVIAFLGVLIIFKIAGYALHQKMEQHYKSQEDEVLFVHWERLYNRLGLCVGALNGAVYFFLLMMPVYAGGYFTAEAGEADAAAVPRLLTRLRAGLHESRLDRVVAAYDPVPPEIYQAADILDLVRHNPPLFDRLAHYPPVLALSQQPEILDIAADAALRQMIRSQATVGDILGQPKIQALMTNGAFIEQIRAQLGGNLADLQEFLNTGKSPKFDDEKILGVWKIDVYATLIGERKKHPEMTRSQIVGLNANWVPVITGFSLMATPDNRIILTKVNPNSAVPTPVGAGTWKRTEDAYQIVLPNHKPGTAEVTPGDDGTLELPWEGGVLCFNKEM
jgi:hypothetical protein